MILLYQRAASHVRIVRVFGFDGYVELPEKIDGLPVEELGPYAFAEQVRRKLPGEVYVTEWSGAELPEAADCKERTASGAEAASRTALPGWEEEKELDGIPVVGPERLTAVSLPDGLLRIGAYAFYNCMHLEQIRISTGTLDLGAGLFTGCSGVERLNICRVPGKKSCFQEVLAELKQTLHVTLVNQEGTVLAKLVFPEYYEEAIENTPARILTQEMHGCGHRYRNAFADGTFQYMVYDRLLPHICVQESADLVIELVLGRLCYPDQLLAEARANYEAYAREHGREIVRLVSREGDLKRLKFVAEADWCSRECMDAMLAEVGTGTGGDPGIAAGIQSLLMEKRHQRFPEAAGKPADKKRRFVW